MMWPDSTAEEEHWTLGNLHGLIPEEDWEPVTDSAQDPCMHGSAGQATSGQKIKEETEPGAWSLGRLSVHIT